MSLLLTGVGGGYQNKISPFYANLKYYYKFNGNTFKTVGTNDGLGTDITYTADYVGLQAVMNGTTSRVLVDNSSDFDISTGDFTINIDITFTSTGLLTFFFGQANVLGQDASLCYFAKKGADDKIVFAIKTNDGVFYEFTQLSSSVLNKKYIIIFERIGDVFNLYINNVLQETQTHSITLATSVYKMSFGGLGEYIGLFTSCNYSLVACWNYALNSSQRTQLYNGGNGLKF